MEAGDALLVGVVVPAVLHVVEVLGEDELRDGAGLDADEDAARGRVEGQREGGRAHVVTDRGPVLAGVPEQPDTNGPGMEDANHLPTKSGEAKSRMGEEKFYHPVTS